MKSTSDFDIIATDVCNMKNWLNAEEMKHMVYNLIDFLDDWLRLQESANLKTILKRFNPQD